MIDDAAMDQTASPSLLLGGLARNPAELAEAAAADPALTVDQMHQILDRATTG